MAGTHWDESTYSKQDAADDLNCRPDFLIPIYPAYLGDEKTPGPLSPLVRVTKETPPTFIAVTHDDQLRGLNAALFSGHKFNQVVANSSVARPEVRRAW